MKRNYFILFLIGVFILSIIVLFNGCTPQQRLQKLLEHHPELKTPDTIFKTIITPPIIIKGFNFDTTVTTKVHDSIFVPYGVIVRNDSIIRVYFHTPADTIPADTIKLQIPVEKIKVIKEDHFLEWLKWIFASLSVIAVIIFLLRKLT